ncbi:hypothetical protein [Streptomyces sp. NPDC093568]|uniref:hypothetical protein n=1 Tax=Streptomyces sp. NPDC093568 TaxID=3366041 RepID=UPI0038285AC6
MEIEPLVLGLLCVLLFGAGVLSAVLGLGLRRGSYGRGVTAAAGPPREVVAAEVDRTRGQYEVQLTRVSGERDQALANSRHLHARLTQLQGSLEARVAAEVDGRLAAELEARVQAGVEARLAADVEARVQAGVEARLAAVLEERVEAGVAARLAEALGRAAARFGPRDTVEAQQPPGPPPQSPAVPHQLPLGRDCAADSTVDGADLGPLIVRAASVRGPRQREGGEHRRDAVMLGLVEEMPSPTLLSVVAAGAPRGLWSQSAAQRACRSLASQLGRYGEHLGTVLGPGTHQGLRTDTVPAGHATSPGEAEDSELGGLLRSALQGVGRSVSLVGLNEGGGTSVAATGGGTEADSEVKVALTALLSQLGDHQRRQHVAFGIGDNRVLRLRDGTWETVFTGVREARLPADGGEVRWARFETRPEDLVAVCSPPLAELLLREDLGEWFADRWVGGRPHLTEFFSDVNVRVRCAGGDRSVVCLWDFGEARRTPTPNA